LNHCRQSEKEHLLIVQSAIQNECPLASKLQKRENKGVVSVGFLAILEIAFTALLIYANISKLLRLLSLQPLYQHLI
jgi:hypothetical protein